MHSDDMEVNFNKSVKVEFSTEQTEFSEITN